MLQLTGGQAHNFEPESEDKNPEIQTIEVKRSPWLTAVLASILPSVILGLALAQLDSVSLLECIVSAIAAIGGNLASIKINDVLEEQRSQADLEITEDVQVRRTRRFVLRRNHVRTKPKRGA